MAKAKGLVEGELVTNIPPSLAQSTPESQISAMKQMARQGVDAIIVNPADSVAESATMEQLGEQGVPIILADVPPAPGSKYQTSTWTQNQVEADAGTLGIIKKGNILIVRGIAGNQNDKVLYNQKVQDLKNCPDIKVASVLYGNWDNGTVKQVVSQYLAAHPQPIDGVLQDGGMFAGVVQAFESRGIKVPPVGVEQCYAGDLSWWLKNIDHYQTVGGCINGLQGGYVYFNAALRILANKGPKYNLLSMPAVAIDNTNLKAYAQPGLPLTSDLELPGPKTAWCDDKCLDEYFNEPGPATASRDRDDRERRAARDGCACSRTERRSATCCRSTDARWTPATCGRSPRCSRPTGRGAASRARPPGPTGSTTCWSPQLPDNPPAPGATLWHWISDPAITVDGDRATASSLWMHVRRGEDDHPLLPTLGGYDDELIREDGRWRFLRRSVSPLVPA